MRATAVAIVIVTVFALGGVGGYVLHGQGTLINLGEGTGSCGDWLADRRSASRTPESYQTAWVDGYLTGVQDGSEGLTQNQTRDSDGRSAWIDNYCQANPLDNLLRAAWALYVELRSL